MFYSLHFRVVPSHTELNDLEPEGGGREFLNTTPTELVYVFSEMGSSFAPRTGSSDWKSTQYVESAKIKLLLSELTAAYRLLIG